MFLLDKYAPKSIKESAFHKDTFDMLKKLSKDEAMPHLIFYGPHGSGKKTLIRLLLEMIYDKEVNNTELVPYNVCGSGNKTTEVQVKQSDHHIVIDPNNNNFDRYIIQHIVKEYAKRMPLNVFSINRTFKTVLINNIDNLSYSAQASLRRTMEKFSGTCRFIMWCRSLSGVFDPVLSRCVCIRVNAPSDSELTKHIIRISAKENINLTLPDLMKIMDTTNNNIKQAMWSLELLRLKLFKKNTYEETIQIITNKIKMADITEGKIIEELIYNILITNIDKTQILRDITIQLCLDNEIAEESKYKITEIMARYNHNMAKGRREMPHFNGAVLNIINILFDYRKENGLPLPE
jgi:replication factor C subunit 3/5